MMDWDKLRLNESGTYMVLFSIWKNLCLADMRGIVDIIPKTLYKNTRQALIDRQDDDYWSTMNEYDIQYQSPKNELDGSYFNGCCFV